MFHRRQILKGFAGFGAALAQPWPGAFAQSAMPTMHIVLLAHGATVSAETRAAAGAAFSARGLPFALSLGPAAPPGADGGEPLLWDAGSIGARAYFQSRILSAARAEAVAAHGPGAAFLSLASPDPGGALGLSGLRAAGLRNVVLVPPETSPAWIESHPAQVTVSRGGHVARAGAIEAAEAYLQAIGLDSGATHAALFVDLDGPEGPVRDLANALAEMVAAHVEAGRAAPILPLELGPRRSLAFQRLIGLRLDFPPAATASEADRAALSALTEALDDAGIGYSLATDDPEMLKAGDCLRLDARQPFAPGEAMRGLSCVAADEGGEAMARQLADLGIGAATGLEPAGFVGLDGNGLQHLGPVYRAAGWIDIDRINARLALSEEPVIALDTSAVALPVHRNAALAALRRIAARPGTLIVDLGRLAESTLSPDPLFHTMRDTRRAAVRIAPVAREKLTDAMRAGLMDDARRAWRFFQTTTRKSSGLPAATIQLDDNGKPGTRFEQLTQWDTGSAIHAHVAARRLEIIEPEAFADWREQLLASLKAATLPGLRLPRDIFDTVNPARGGQGFNICDTARLLSALNALDSLTPGGDEEVRALIAGWNLAEVLIDGEPHSIERGAPVASSNSHCTSYISRSFARWGLRAVSEYDAFYRGETETDRRMHLLARIADIGPLGAEPLLMEALEFGLNAPSLYLRDVLLAAQILETEKTGRLMAPSEGPMERAPWFSYQGLRVEFEGDARWGVMVPGGGPETRTETFRTTMRMLSPKAAFLWAATHPHPYSDRLLAYARDHASLPVGFASGIYLDGDRPTEGYTDINTNGVILQAVARLLGR